MACTSLILLMEIATGQCQGGIPVVVEADFCISRAFRFKSGDALIDLMLIKAASVRGGGCGLHSSGGVDGEFGGNVINQPDGLD